MAFPVTFSKTGVIYVYNAYYVKETLKELGFKFDGNKKAWYRPITDTELDEIIIDELTKHKIISNEAYSFLKEYIQRQKERFLKTKTNIKIPIPPGKELFDFQKAFVEFASNKNRVLLADEMGLGKTIQTISLINYVNPAKTLIVCPAFLKVNWKNELNQWLVDKDTQILIINTKNIDEFVSLLTDKKDKKDKIIF